MKNKLKSSKLRLRSSICPMRGEVSGLWCDRLIHKLASTWQSVSNWTRQMPRSHPNCKPSQHARASAASALIHSSYHLAVPPHVLPSESRRMKPDGAERSPSQNAASTLHLTQPGSGLSQRFRVAWAFSFSRCAIYHRSKVVSTHWTISLTDSGSRSWRLPFLAIHIDHIWTHHIISPLHL